MTLDDVFEEIRVAFSVGCRDEVHIDRRRAALFESIGARGKCEVFVKHFGLVSFEPISNPLPALALENVEDGYVAIVRKLRARRHG